MVAKSKFSDLRIQNRLPKNSSKNPSRTCKSLPMSDLERLILAGSPRSRARGKRSQGRDATRECHKEVVAMRINSEDSTRVQNTLSSMSSSRSKALERLASAMRINRASDDAAGLSVSEGLRSLIRENQMAQRNANDGLGMLQIADSGGQQITDSLQRMRELAMQSSNGTYNANDREAMQKEYAALGEEIGRIAQSTTYNGKSLLAGGDQGVSFQVSGVQGEGSVISFQANVDLSSNLNLGNIGTAGGAQSALSSIDDTLKNVMGMRSTFGAAMNRLDSTMTNLGNSIANVTDAESRIRDTNYAQETSNNIRDSILQKSALAMAAQANQANMGIMGLLR